MVFGAVFMKYTHIIWDFNGTLLDDLDECFDVLQELLRRRGLPLLEGLDSYREVFGFPVIDYYRAVGFDFECEDYGELAEEWGQLYVTACSKPRLCVGAIDAIEAFKAAGVPQLILSATKHAMLTEQLKTLGISDYFSETLALGNLHATSKVQLGIDWMARNEHGVVLFIGDTVHDFETASAMGAECILIASGHQSRQRLEATGVPVLNNASELIAYLGL